MASYRDRPLTWEELDRARPELEIVPVEVEVDDAPPSPFVSPDAFKLPKPAKIKN